jgi:hypothetical protein
VSPKRRENLAVSHSPGTLWPEVLRHHSVINIEQSLLDNNKCGISRLSGTYASAESKEQRRFLESRQVVIVDVLGSTTSFLPHFEALTAKLLSWSCFSFLANSLRRCNRSRRSSSSVPIKFLHEMFEVSPLETHYLGVASVLDLDLK